MKKNSLKIVNRPPCPRSVRSILKRIAADIRDSLLTRGGKSKLHPRDWSDVITKKIVKKWKLVEFMHDGCSRFAYRSSKYEVIIKCPYGGHKKSPSRAALPTEFVEISDDGYDNRIFIQPMIDVSWHSVERAFDLLWNDRRVKRQVRDLHDGNVGVFRHKYAVVHDW